jgi:hypothetical protein
MNPGPGRGKFPSFFLRPFIPLGADQKKTLLVPEMGREWGENGESEEGPLDSKSGERMGRELKRPNKKKKDLKP